jgi:hypothetical protein
MTELAIAAATIRKNMMSFTGKALDLNLAAT